MNIYGPDCLECGEPYLDHGEPGGACPLPFGGFSREGRYRGALRTAITISEDAAFNLRMDQRESEARARATPFVCDLAAMCLVEASLHAVRRMVQPSLGYEMACRSEATAYPGYVFIRDFLIGELDADRTLACRIAAKHTALHNRHFRFLFGERSPFYAGRDIGWL